MHQHCEQSREARAFCFIFLIILYSSCIAYEKPSYSLDDFTGLHLCSRIVSLSHNPARCPDFNKPLQLWGSKPSYIPVFAVHPLPLHSASPLVVPSSSPSSNRSMSHESNISLGSIGFVPTSVISMNRSTVVVTFSSKMVSKSFGSRLAPIVTFSVLSLRNIMSRHFWHSSMR
jgi:hypothetical protein